ncbi:MAG: hypothetical protein RLZZ09_2256 [Pseudomonadota bacterium]
MSYLLFKYLLTAALVVGISELSHHNARLSALLAALPLVATLSLVWMHAENQPDSRLIRFALDTLWFVLPTLPMFWLFARLHGLWGFWPALLTACLVTVLLFRLELTLLRRFGIDLL